MGPAQRFALALLRRRHTPPLRAAAAVLGPVVSLLGSWARHPVPWLVSLGVLAATSGFVPTRGRPDAAVVALGLLLVLRIHREMERPQAFARPGEFLAGAASRSLPVALVLNIGVPFGYVWACTLIYLWPLLTPFMLVLALALGARNLWRGRRAPENSWAPVLWAVVMATPPLSALIVPLVIVGLVPIALAGSDSLSEAWRRTRAVGRNPLPLLSWGMGAYAILIGLHEFFAGGAWYPSPEWPFERLAFFVWAGFILVVDRALRAVPDPTREDPR